MSETSSQSPTRTAKPQFSGATPRNRASLTLGGGASTVNLFGDISPAPRGDVGACEDVESVAPSFLSPNKNLELKLLRAYAQKRFQEGSMKIGKLVQRHIPAIFENCETKDPSEFSRLQEARYCKETLDINFPFCRSVTQISQEDRVRYYQQVYTVFNVPVRVTSQWFNPPTSNSLPLFQRYLQKCGIPLDESEESVSAPMLASMREQKARGRYKSPALGNGQNAVVRYILGQIGEEQFNADHWAQVKADFGHRCAYCGTDGELLMDHIIPINRTALGEHRLGNLIPACRSCNTKKGSDDFRDFLKNSPAKIAGIEAHMAKLGYTPIGDHKMLKNTLEMAHADIRQLADRYVTLIGAMLQDEHPHDSP